MSNDGKPQSLEELAAEVNAAREIKLERGILKYALFGNDGEIDENDILPNILLKDAAEAAHVYGIKGFDDWRLLSPEVREKVKKAYNDFNDPVYEFIQGNDGISPLVINDYTKEVCNSPQLDATLPNLKAPCDEWKGLQ